MKVSFVKPRTRRTLAVDDEVTRWHFRHGWVWNVMLAETWMPLGVVFCTLLGGDGCAVHFSVKPGVVPPKTAMLAAIRKAIRMLAPVCPLLLATIPDDAEHRHLILVLYRCGFRRSDLQWRREGGVPVAALQYFPREKGIVR